MSEIQITLEPATQITIQVDQLLINPETVTVQPTQAPQINVSDDSDLQNHLNDENNPHNTTAAQVGADPAGTALLLLTDHIESSNPHPELTTLFNFAIQGLQDSISNLAPLAALEGKQDSATVLSLLSALSIANNSGKVITVNELSNGFTLKTPASSSGSNGIVLKSLYSERSDYIQISNTILSQNAAPNQTNGLEILTISLTPASANSKILVRGNIQFYNGASNPLVTLALFRNLETTPLRIWTVTAQSYTYNNIPYSVRVSVLGTTQETYKLRIGTSNAGLPINLNRIDNNTFMGNLTGSNLEIIEYAS